MTMTDDLQLDFDTRPVISLNGDTARTRRTDPLTSHAAGDRSQPGISALRLAVLRLLREEPLSTGNELNLVYAQRFERRGWPKCAWDSPRKRAQEMVELGFVLVQGERDGERQLIISATGLDIVS